MTCLEVSESNTMSTESETEADNTDSRADVENTIDSRDDIPDRHEIVELRRNRGLTNERISKNHITEFSPRQVGIFCSMYGVSKGWKDETYLREQIDGGVTPEDLADQWSINEETVRKWMSRFDIEENTIPDKYDVAISSLQELADETDTEKIDTDYSDLAETLSDDKVSYFD